MADYLSGLDVSHYQSDRAAIDFLAARRAGQQFVIIKASEGTAPDPDFAQNRAAAERAGMPWGAYHFYRPNLNALEQARVFLNTIGPAMPLRAALDLEAAPASAALYLLGVEAWLEKIYQALGARPLIYTRASFWDHWAPRSGQAARIALRHPLWIADYRDRPAPQLPLEWRAQADEAFVIWQYGIGTSPGVTGAVDLNRARVPVEALMAEQKVVIISNVTTDNDAALLRAAQQIVDAAAQGDHLSVAFYVGDNFIPRLTLPAPPAPPPAQPIARALIEREVNVRDRNGNPITVSGAPLRIAAGVTKDIFAFKVIGSTGNRAFLEPEAQGQGQNIWVENIRVLNPAVGGGDGFLLVRPVASRLIWQGFGAHPENYSQFNLPGHDGIDYPAQEGEEVHAAADGTIRQVIIPTAEWPAAGGHPYGNHVRIDHAGGYQSIYAHLQQPIPVRRDQPVQAGDVIGKADNSGNSSDTHLHLALKKAGATAAGYRDALGRAWPSDLIDPAPYIS